MIKRLARKLWTESPKEFLRGLVKNGSFVEAGSLERYVWCLSTGRVGTQTLAHLAKLNESVHAEHEPSPNLFALSNLSFKHGQDGGCGEILEESFRLARKHVTDCKGAVYVETSPQVTFLAPVIKRVFPNSFFVHVVRDPFEVIRSGMRRKWYDGHPYDRWRPVPAKDSGLDWAAFSLLEKNAWLWSETNKWIVDFLKGMRAEDQLLLRSGDLFSGNRDEISRFYAILGVEEPEPAGIESVLGKKLNSQKAGAYPAAEDWDTADVKRVHQMAGETMAALGFNGPAS